MKEVRKPSTLFLPKPVALITSGLGGGKDNVMTAAWVNVVCMDPPMIAVAVRHSRYTHRTILESRQFVVKIPGEELLPAVDLCGMVSGWKGDKFELAGLHREPGSITEAPLVAECPINIECEVNNAIELGSHTLFVGEVLAVHVDRDVLNEKGDVDVRRMRPFVLNQREYWNMGDRIGEYGFTASSVKVIP
jgi:flavin reductase (DIM6/NTAB) family NADH-FMN oxidoreductase RutF